MPTEDSPTFGLQRLILMQRKVNAHFPGQLFWQTASNSVYREIIGGIERKNVH